MKPPRIIYLLVLFAATGLVFQMADWARGNFRNGRVAWEIFAMALLCFYFGFFAIRRLKYDRALSGKKEVLHFDLDAKAGETQTLCKLKAVCDLKVKLELHCKNFEADESFLIQIRNVDGKSVFEETFVPVLGGFRFETIISATSLPALVVCKNINKLTRKIQGAVTCSEIRPVPSPGKKTATATIDHSTI